MKKFSPQLAPLTKLIMCLFLVFTSITSYAGNGIPDGQSLEEATFKILTPFSLKQQGLLVVGTCKSCPQLNLTFDPRTQITHQGVTSHRLKLLDQLQGTPVTLIYRPKTQFVTQIILR